MMAYKIVNMWVPQNMYRYKSPYKMSPNYLVVHNTANTAAARNEVAYMRRNTNQTSYHVAIDHNEVVQAIPFNRNAWHAGDGNNPKDSGNRLAIGVEICYSMDNGYSGAYSKRHRQAEENAALYIAYVLNQYGWGVDRLRQHWHYTRKDCPHKMRAHKGWNGFKNRVKEHLDAIRGNKSPSTVKPKPTPKPSGSTYTVKSGDTLWGISKASGVSVANLKSWNGLSSNTIIVGQKLNLKKTNKKPTGSSKKKTPYTVGDWKTNKYGTQWIEAHGTITITASQVMSRFNSPFDVKANEGGWAKKGWSHKYFEMVRVRWSATEGYIMVAYMIDANRKYVPYRPWNPTTGEVGPEWATLT